MNFEKPFEKPFELHLGDCLKVLKTIPDNSIDSIVTDPPYGFRFMGKRWDYDVPSVEIWEECLRVLKPGGHLLAFAGTRTQHRMTVRIEDAGFEIRDMIAWVYGSGFPKSMDVSKAIDKAAGAEREKGPVDPVRAAKLVNQRGDYETDAGWSAGNRSITIDPPATEAALQWDGWGTALKPALEPITVARKPLEEKTVAKNVLKYGTGAVNIDECRVETSDKRSPSTSRANESIGTFKTKERTTEQHESGRWPANLIHDGSEEVLELFPETKSGKCDNGFEGEGNNKIYGKYNKNLINPETVYGDQGSAARFFYCAKANKKDRGEGNKHPTVKPTELMQYLCRLITPPNGITLDPFMGSGSTGKAAIREGFKFVGIEMEEESFDTAERRINDEYEIILEKEKIITF